MLKRITLHLARTAEFPEGSATRGYELIAPVNPHGHLDEAGWRCHHARCHVRRFWTGEPDRLGWLAHRPGGLHGAHWAIDYDRASSEDDEPLFKLESHRLLPGEYLTIEDRDDELHTFKVVDVQPV